MKYKSDDPADQPIHDMMDDIEAAYQKAENAGGHPLKILTAIGYMQQLYAKNKGFSKDELQFSKDLNELTIGILAGGSDKLTN